LHLGHIEVDHQQIGGVAGLDAANRRTQVQRIGAADQRVLDPAPAAAARGIADRVADRQALRGLGSIEQTEAIGARAVGAESETHAELVHQQRRRHRIALPGTGHRVVGNGGAMLAQQRQFARRRQRGVGGQQFRPDGTDRRQVLDRPQAEPVERALDRHQVLIQMSLERDAQLAAAPRHVHQYRVAGGFRDRHRQRGMYQRRAGMARQEGVGPRSDLRQRLDLAAIDDVVADVAEHQAQPGLGGGARQIGHRHLGARAGIGHRGEAAAQRLQRAQFGGQVQGLLVEELLHRHPDAPEDLRRLTEHQRLAEALGQVVVGVDHARHQQPARQRHDGA